MTLHGCGKNWGLATSGGNGHHTVLEMFSLSVVWRTFHAMPSYDAGKALHTAAKARGEHGFGAQWAGQGAPLSRSMPVVELVRTLKEELERCRA